ncbi:MAG: hypothetical protein K6E10_03985 [Eubacterium sp.]|nr:hypothetical protein [Eubacterium sp.]
MRKLGKVIMAGAMAAAMCLSSAAYSFGDVKAASGWESDSKGWWYEENGWYPVNQWYEIGGYWYFFKEDGYMDYSEYRDGCWLNADGSWNTAYSGGHWESNSTGYWYADNSGWYPTSTWLWIDGNCYYFKDSGYMAADEWIGDSYVDKNGAYVEGKVKTAENTNTKTETETKTETKTETETEPVVEKYDYSKYMTVEFGTDKRKVEFVINEETWSAEEAIAEGYTVEGNIASKEFDDLMTAKYTFTKLPSAEDLKSFPLDNKLAPAVGVALAHAVCTPSEVYTSRHKNEVWDVLDYLNGDSGDVPLLHRQGNQYDSWKANVDKGAKFAYFKGASPANNYTPNQPYVIEVRESPYYMSEGLTITGYKPDIYMAFVQTSCDDAGERYVDVYQSKDGNWYTWYDSWKQLFTQCK